jgi:hypothetical protein
MTETEDSYLPAVLHVYYKRRVDCWKSMGNLTRSPVLFVRITALLFSRIFS